MADKVKATAVRFKQRTRELADELALAKEENAELRRLVHLDALYKADLHRELDALRDEVLRHRNTLTSVKEAISTSLAYQPEAHHPRPHPDVSDAPPATTATATATRRATASATPVV